MIVLFLLLGAIINVAVAWGFALLTDVANRTDRRADSAFVWRVGDHWSAYRYSTTGVLLFVSLRSWKGPSDEQIDRPPDLIIPRWSGFQTASEQFRAHAAQYEVRIGDARGWPMLTLWSERGSSYSQPGPWTSTGVAKGAIPLWTDPQTDFGLAHALPMRPIWPGFAINTIFYAAILWLLFAFPFVIRRRRRIKRGLCPACAYPVGTNSVCTECGKAVKP